MKTDTIFMRIDPRLKVAAQNYAKDELGESLAELISRSLEYVIKNKIRL